MKKTIDNHARKIVHIFPISHFLNSYITFIKQNFDINNHHFIIIGTPTTQTPLSSEFEDIPHTILPYGINNLLNNFFSAKLTKILYSAQNIILHSYSVSAHIEAIFFLRPSMLKKAVWVIWGGDAHDKAVSNTPVNKLLLIVKKYQIKLIPYVAGCKPDFNLIQQNYNITPKTVTLNNFYTNNTNEYNTDIFTNENKTVNIIIGSDSLPSNRHKEIIDLCSKYKEENIRYYIPLPRNKSYLDISEYINSVESYAKSILGDKVTIFSEVIEKETYHKILRNMDIGIYNSNIQQGVGTITIMLSSGAKIYLDSKMPLWNIFSDLGFSIHPISNLEEEPYSEFVQNKDTERQGNVKNALIQFGEQKRVEQWEQIFNLNR